MQIILQKNEKIISLMEEPFLVIVAALLWRTWLRVAHVLGCSDCHAHSHRFLKSV